ncbi:MAG: hypothetical protein ACYTBJ_18510 [Planctomycetota bacterium]|jgi:hypothetical protein
MNEVEQTLIALFNLAAKGRYDVDATGAAQITKLLENAQRVIQSTQEESNESEDSS